HIPLAAPSVPPPPTRWAMAAAMRSEPRSLHDHFAQPLLRSTARVQCSVAALRSAGLSFGLNSLSIAQLRVTSPVFFQNPVASPARYAAPSAVVSFTFGRCTVTPLMSD